MAVKIKQIKEKIQIKNVPKISGGMREGEGFGTFLGEGFGTWKIT